MERAGRRIFLTVDDAQALATESSLIAVVSPELQRWSVRIKSAYNASSFVVHGIQPQYQQIRTIDIARGREFAVIPWQMAIVARVLRWLPNWLYDRLAAGRKHKRRRGETGATRR